jgi:hypothetical protein
LYNSSRGGKAFIFGAAGTQFFLTREDFAVFWRNFRDSRRFSQFTAGFFGRMGLFRSNERGIIVKILTIMPSPAVAKQPHRAMPVLRGFSRSVKQSILYLFCRWQKRIPLLSLGRGTGALPVLRGFSRSVKQDSEASIASGGKSDRRERMLAPLYLAQRGAQGFSPWRSTVRGHMREKYAARPSLYGAPVYQTQQGHKTTPFHLTC